MLLQNRTISMILTIPQVEELISRTKENLDTKPKPPSIPIYHGSIIHIEKHLDDENISDLVVRVPNFHHISIVNNDQLSETESQRIKRPAPICPTRTDLNPPISNAKRLAIGLRNLSRAFKSKQAANLNQIRIIPVVPDVEVITEKFDIPTRTKEKSKSSKFLTPKILFVKRKHFKIKRKQQQPSNTIEKQTDTEDTTNKNLKDQESIKIDHDGNKPEQQSTTVSQTIDPESTSTHPYSTISGHPPPNPQIIITEHDIEPILPNTFISNATIDLRKESQSFDHEQIEEGIYVVHPNGDAYSETYEISYELDPEYQRFLEENKQQIYYPEIKDQPSVKFNIGEYEDLASALSNWIPILPKIPSSNTYEQVERDNNIEEIHQETSHDESSTSNLDDTPMINEDYTVILEFLKHALQIDSTSNDDFNKQLEQLFQTDKINEFE